MVPGKEIEAISSDAKTFPPNSLTASGSHTKLNCPQSWNARSPIRASEFPQSIADIRAQPWKAEAPSVTIAYGRFEIAIAEQLKNASASIISTESGSAASSNFAQFENANW
jgi:hypothetical protein